MPTELLTVRQMAQEAANSEAFWRKLIARREIPVLRVGRLVRVRRRDFEAFLGKGLRPALRPGHSGTGPALNGEGGEG